MRALPLWFRGLPVPLALAAASAGRVVLGATLDQHGPHVHAYEAGGLHPGRTPGRADRLRSVRP